MTCSTIAVLGGGAWGTALAAAMRRAGHRVRLWARDAEIVRAINETNQNPHYLPGETLPEGIEATTDFALAVADVEAILVVIPAQSLPLVLEEHKAVLRGPAPLVLCAKGIERDSGKRLSERVSEILSDATTSVLSGPSFAHDVVRGLPTAVSIACADEAKAVSLAHLLSTSQFRCYSTTDVIGVEIGGALKNVLAIAAGASQGAKLGASAQAALVTRGFAELRRVGEALGARPETLMGLSGLGDLMLTSSSAQSRNYAYGLALGKGGSLIDMKLAEGVATAHIAARIVRDKKIRAPIIEMVDRVLAAEVSVKEALDELMQRPLRTENDETGD
ncbi:NAD(P)H-dependent glycerol-3-phosphate dehydrogenase [Limoniibacter endophyticus]|uniref:Glycerol-3-phosphate dehydrogenase [NAD(P)+] n=1 Tax=Limoniibacter endophyticus TaxID=1565040 RepID=A0A8J3DQH0_9HYPH|nr:NAD(P)H-dependent glycerol-3-phosphate dehydrogenase [Limoniibacter endophyticus]GHC73963.1 glycerol-3-phosphate dehydrogenase [NAD(P)+] [Limoniibacter endophyticus]